MPNAASSAPRLIDGVMLSSTFTDLKQHRARLLAARAYREPYVHRYWLNKSRTLVETPGARIPDLPPYDADQDGRFPLEDLVATAIDKLRANKSTGATREESRDGWQAQAPAPRTGRGAFW